MAVTKKGARKSKRPRKDPAGVRPWVVTTLSILFVLLVGLGVWVQMSNYEKGVLDVYANQQDGYVQLVLEQIQLVEKRGGTEEQIKEILSTLDASTNRYWTLSRQSSLIFVKDVLETNRYQSQVSSTASYFKAPSAKDFIDALAENRVTHDLIQMGEQSYVASGVKFTFQGEPYRVCLLTNSFILLEHNAYLTAKINLLTLAAVALCAFVIAIELLSFLAGKYRKKYIAEAAANKALRQQAEKLNDALHKEDLYDARRTAYAPKALPMLWEKLEGKDPWPLTLLILRCNGAEDQKQFLQFTQFQMNAKILRAFLDDTHILLILLRIEALELSAIKENIGIPGVLLTGELTLTQAPEEPLDRCVNSFVERTLEDEKQIAL